MLLSRFPRYFLILFWKSKRNSDKSEWNHLNPLPCITGWQRNEEECCDASSFSRKLAVLRKLEKLESLAWMCARDKSIVVTAEICFYRPHWAGHKYILKPIPSQQGAEVWAEVPVVLPIACGSCVTLTMVLLCFNFFAVSKVIMLRWSTWTGTWL